MSWKSLQAVCLLYSCSVVLASFLHLLERSLELLLHPTVVMLISKGFELPGQWNGPKFAEVTAVTDLITGPRAESAKEPDKEPVVSRVGPSQGPEWTFLSLAVKAPLEDGCCGWVGPQV